jgi:hypothetical protein
MLVEKYLPVSNALAYFVQKGYKLTGMEETSEKKLFNRYFITDIGRIRTLHLGL